MVLSFVTVHGSVNSHTAILARTMAIPALIGTEELPLDDTVDGKLAVVDGLNGKIYVEPDSQTLEAMKKRRQAELEKKELLQLLKGKENVTLDGKKIMLYANIGNIKDLATVIQNDAGGIGLFRSEFIYLEKDRYPTEEEQFSIYKTAVETMAGKRVIIRTLDIGAVGYWGMAGWWQEKRELSALQSEYESARELQQALLEEKTALEGELNELREQNGDANETLQSWKVWKESLEATLAG